MLGILSECSTLRSPAKEVDRFTDTSFNINFWGEVEVKENMDQGEVITENNCFNAKNYK